MITPAEAPSRPPVRHAALAFIFVTVVLDMVALGVIVPVLPKLVIQFAGGDTARASRIYGLFGTVWALTSGLALEPGTWTGLRPDGAGADPELAVCGTSDFGTDGSQRPDRRRVYR